jgi:hypothetical protein
LSFSLKFETEGNIILASSGANLIKLFTLNFTHKLFWHELAVSYFCELDYFSAIEQHVLDTNAGKKLSYGATDV